MEQIEALKDNYNIPSNNRELQLITEVSLLEVIITYQVITGNYSISSQLKPIR